MYRKNTLETYQSAIKFMEDHLFEKLTIKDVAQHCCVSSSGLEKNFAKFAKSGVMRCFLDMKLEYAAKMLREGHTVNYLAKALSFSSAAHLSMAFKKKYGVSPLKYKYSLLERAEG